MMACCLVQASARATSPEEVFAGNDDSKPMWQRKETDDTRTELGAALCSGARCAAADQQSCPTLTSLNLVYEMRASLPDFGWKVADSLCLARILDVRLGVEKPEIAGDLSLSMSKKQRRVGSIKAVKQILRRLRLLRRLP